MIESFYVDILSSLVLFVVFYLKIWYDCKGWFLDYGCSIDEFVYYLLWYFVDVFKYNS